MQSRLKLAREARGLTQVELAKVAGVPQQTISALETKQSSVTKADTLFLLSDALGVNARWLATGDGEMDKPPSSELIDLANSMPPDKLAAVLAVIKALK